jgi:hypothetical protein
MVNKKSGKKRTQVKDLPSGKKKLSASKMKKIRGGFQTTSEELQEFKRPPKPGTIK